ncbi:MAG TPA: hypothetical protein VFE78_02205 [Gemmataceae bacterium]|jgi:hypothetical protein|nr:hypothetical protein [Gemmataceae bacterium]
MIEIKCPRCEQYWYTDDKEGGRVRLCDRCAGALRRGRRGGQPLGAFAAVTAALLGADLLLVVLARLLPGVFEKVLLGYGLVLSVAGAVGWRLLAPGWGLHVGDIDWGAARWPALVGLMGLACLLAYASFVAPR